jgi:ketosteroid isomerase-like protein
VIAKFADARNTHDLQALVALYANDAESIGPTGVLFARGRPALLEMWSRQVKSIDHVDRTISKIDFPGPNVAVVHVFLSVPATNRNS